MTTDKPIKVIVADDHQLFLNGLESLLKEVSFIKIIGLATNGQQVLDLLRYHSDTDVAILDIEMPVLNGIQTAIKIKENYPDTKVLALTMYKSEGFVTKMIQTGINGYILKERSQEELVEAIKAVKKGEDYYDRKITHVIVNSIKSDNNNKKTKLTKTEVKVLSLLGLGLSNKQIADKLFISIHTVNTHCRNMIDKLGLQTGSKGLVKYAIENGYTQDED